MSTAVVEWQDLALEFVRHGRSHRVLDGVDLELGDGEILGLVGESGSGKSLTCFAAMGLLDVGARIVRGGIRMGELELTTLPQPRLAALRGSTLSMIFQDPLTALSPHLTAAALITESMRLRRGLSRGAARARAREILVDMGIVEPDRVLDSRPHALSGGQRQRVLIAAAVALEPRIIFADEPTTALDLASQVRVVEILQGLRRRIGCAIVFVSHDLSLLARFADRIAVMEAGRVVETGTPDRVLSSPVAPITRRLLDSRPALRGPRRLGLGGPG